VGECFFSYRPTRVVPDKRPLNGCVCVCCFLCVLGLLNIKLRIQSNSQICSCLPHIDVTRCAIEGEIWPQHYFPSLDLGLLGSVENKVRVCITNR